MVCYSAFPARRGLLGLLLGVAAVPAQDAIPFTGRWRSESTTKGGIGGVYEIDARGIVKYTSAAIVDMDYRQEGNQLVLAGQPVGMGWHPDGRLQLNFGNNVLEDLVRRGDKKDAAQPLVGEWAGTRVMNGVRLPYIYQFGANGKALMVIWIKSRTGKLANKSAGSWQITYPGFNPSSLEYDAATAKLAIATNGGQPYSFARF